MQIDLRFQNMCGLPSKLGSVHARAVYFGPGTDILTAYLPDHLATARRYLLENEVRNLSRRASNAGEVDQWLHGTPESHSRSSPSAACPAS